MAMVFGDRHGNLACVAGFGYMALQFMWNNNIFFEIQLDLEIKST